MLTKIRHKSYPLALSALLTLLVLLNGLIASPVFAAECAGTGSCG